MRPVFCIQYRPPVTGILAAGFLLLLLAVPAGSDLFAAEAQNLHAALKGRWEGSLNGTFRRQQVSWRFEIDSEGKLLGFMGPSTAGMPVLPMQDLIIDGTQISFHIESQHGLYTGTVGDGVISGSWRQGPVLPLEMKKKVFAFPLAASIRKDLAGNWEILDSDRDIHLSFRETEDNLLSGTLDIPAMGLYDMPLVELFVAEDGSTEFATDNGRRFTGRLVNGVLIGDYRSGNFGFRRAFVPVDLDEKVFNLALPEPARTRLSGRWESTSGRRITLHFQDTEAGGNFQAYLTRGGRGTPDPLLEVVLQGNSFSFVSLSGRTFTGTFSDNEISGQYRLNSRPSQVTFDKVPP